GSAGVDVAVASDITIIDRQIHVVPSTVTGPLGRGLSALLLGRSSASKQGLLVVPGVIDADYTGNTGNVGITLQDLDPPTTIKAGTRIAQLVPFIAQVPHAPPKNRGSASFGSSGQTLVAFTQHITAEKPTRQVTIVGSQNRQLQAQMLMDTGSDVTII
ncbi:hypothetical protein N322_00882, partial [Cariama cristata]